MTGDDSLAQVWIRETTMKRLTAQAVREKVSPATLADRLLRESLEQSGEAGVMVLIEWTDPCDPGGAHMPMGSRHGVHCSRCGQPAYAFGEEVVQAVKRHARKPRLRLR